MSAERFDTSGRVSSNPSWRMGGEQGLDWSDLNPFTQGYVEAMLTPMIYIGECEQGSAYEHMRFSDLAPETLARIMKDCANARRTTGPDTPENGAAFWRVRNDAVAQMLIAKAIISLFPPLTPYLGEDGKVHLREQST